MGWLVLAVEIVLIAMAICSAALFYESYWRWRDCFNDLGRCFDPVSQNVYLEQSGLVWGGFTGILVLMALVLWLSRRA